MKIKDFSIYYSYLKQSNNKTFNNIIKKQLDTIFRVGNIGKFVAIDVLERITILGNLLSSNVEKMTKQEAEKYKKFLESELKKIDEIRKK